jgi:quercetin dioxygenase-like cupin family protein
VVDGCGVFVVDGVDFPGPAGKCVFVKAGIPHAMRNNSDQSWTVRITYQQRLYARHVGKLVERALRKRLGLER